MTVENVLAGTHQFKLSLMLLNLLAIKSDKISICSYVNTSKIECFSMNDNCIQGSLF